MQKSKVQKELWGLKCFLGIGTLCQMSVEWATWEKMGQSWEVGTRSHILKMADLLPSIILRKSE